MTGLLEIRLGLVVWPSTNPIRAFSLSVSFGSPPSTKIFVFGFVVCIFKTTPYFVIGLTRTNRFDGAIAVIAEFRSGGNPGIPIGLVIYWTRKMRENSRYHKLKCHF